MAAGGVPLAGGRSPAFFEHEVHLTLNGIFLNSTGVEREAWNSGIGRHQEADRQRTPARGRGGPGGDSKEAARQRIAGRLEKTTFLLNYKLLNSALSQTAPVNIWASLDAPDIASRQRIDTMPVERQLEPAITIFTLSVFIVSASQLHSELTPSFTVEKLRSYSLCDFSESLLPYRCVPTYRPQESISHRLDYFITFRQYACSSQKSSIKRAGYRISGDRTGRRVCLTFK